MANRSYLYSARLDPDGKPQRVSGVSEWNWDIPLAHKVLMSGSPTLVASSIWGGDGVPALLADFDAGVAAFETHLAALPASEEVEGSRVAFRDHLRSDDVRASHLLLEPAEIFDMDEEVEFADAAQALLEEIVSLTPAPVTAAGLAEATGSGSWRRHLYYG